jgi:hypothetical protein
MNHMPDGSMQTYCDACRIIEGNEKVAERNRQAEERRERHSQGPSYYSDRPSTPPTAFEQAFSRLIFLIVTVGLAYFGLTLPLIIGIVPLLFALATLIFVLM